MSDITTLFPNKEQFDTMNMYLAAIARNTDSLDINTYDDIKQIFRRGLGKACFKRGDIIPVYKLNSLTIGIGDSTGITAATIVANTFLTAMNEPYGNKTFVLSFDGSVWKKENGENINLAVYGITTTGTAVDGDTLVITETVDTMNFVFRHVRDYNAIIEAQDCITTFQFDAPEAMYYCSEALPAGTYNFTLNKGCYANDTSEDGTYQFTTSIDIPAGGQIRHSTIGASRAYSPTNITNGTLTTYASASTTTPLEENITVTIGSAGTNLGTVTAREPALLSENCNFTDRIYYGSNNWRDSAARKWLNSDAASNWWTPTNNFDRPPTNTDIAGFMCGLDPKFLSLVVDTTVSTPLSIADGYGTGTTVDKFFLASLPELYMTAGDTWDYYKDFSDLSSPGTGADTNRIKTLNGAPQYYWLRSPSPSHAIGVYIGNPSGGLNTNLAYYASGVAPACQIGIDESDTTVSA